MLYWPLAHSHVAVAAKCTMWKLIKRTQMCTDFFRRSSELRYEIYFRNTREIHMLKYRAGAFSAAVSAIVFRMCTGFGLPFSVVTLFCVLESLSWNRKSDVLFTGLSAWEVSDNFFFFSFCFLCGEWDKVYATVCCCDMTFGLSRFLLYLVLFWLDVFADLFSPSVHSEGVEVLTPQLLCLAAVWLSGLFFLPLFDYSLIMVSSLHLLYLFSSFMSF